MENVTELRVPLVVDIGFGTELGRREVAASRAGARTGAGSTQIAAFLGDAYWAPDTIAGAARSRRGRSRRSTSSSTRSGSTPGSACSTSGAGRAATRSRSRDAGSTSSASTCHPSSSRSRAASAERSAWPTACASRSLDVRELDVRRRVRRGRSACARAASGCSAAATTRPTCSARIAAHAAARRSRSP